ncbi:MAG TPA: OmpA family protein [Solimonas sp.]
MRTNTKRWASTGGIGWTMATATVIALASAPVAAQQTDELRPYVTGGYSHVFDDNGRASDIGMGVHLGGGWSLGPHWGFEIGGFHHGFDSSGGSGNEWREYGGKIDWMFFYGRDRRFSPYVGFGFGGVRTELKGSGLTSTDAFADGGVGFFKYFGNSDLGLRADLRYRWLDAGNLPGVGPFEEVVARVGLVMALGSRPAPPPPPDADGDGVPDARDECPDTPAGSKVDAKGCPAVADSDGDGVGDEADLCPGTPPGLAVDENGCPRDGNRFKIVGQGAELRFEDVYFAFDGQVLSDYGRAMLDDAVRVINQLVEKYPALKIDIAGHTDAEGTDGYNLGLSERRANAVKQYLIRKGVRESRISTYSYGEAKPQATNDTPEGRKLNRRAETRTRAE